MLVKVNTSLAGADFSFRHGEEVDIEVFAALVGNGWEGLCAPIVNDGKLESTIGAPVIDVVDETADLPTAIENTSKRGRRK